ncbi:gliding motility-associated C-terminal domain-containing protein [Pontibacter sp. E15-1]|nr:gliding motility-associated C-terminal domain-containing protein [Pontibacter sp. E15-1]
MNEAFVVEVSCLPLELQVYSRSGRLVLQKHGYQNDWSGEGLANGTYYYLLRDAGGVTWKGWVEVLR